MLQDRKETIYSKGFDITGRSRQVPLDNGRIRIGLRNLDDAVLKLGDYRKYSRCAPFWNKETLFQALLENNYLVLREFSRFFYKTSGIYQKLCQYVAFMYRYDWYVVPEILDEDVSEDKILKDFSKLLNMLDNSYIKKVCGEIALKVVIDGCYYGYIASDKDAIIIQELPVEYCRSRFNVRNAPVVEFNMAFFDTFKEAAYRMKILNLFPDEFKKGYMLYKQGKLISEITGQPHGWYVLTPGLAFKFNINGSDVPNFVNVIPSILDLDEAQDLDRQKAMQQLLKILVQKLPLDKNGDLIFDVDEARDIHNNAVAMLSRAIGVDILTTFAEVDSIDISDATTNNADDDLVKVERAIYNASGVSKNLFNTDGNLSLEKSILEDESNIRNLLLQFINFFDRIVQDRNSSRKKYSFRFYMLETTQYNYQTLSKMYKEQAQIGHSKILPQIALGHSQNFILNTAYFENNVLHLTELMLPNLMSSTMSPEDILDRNKQSGSGNNQGNTEGEVGRPEKSDDQKSEKTIQNEESMN